MSMEYIYTIILYIVGGVLGLLLFMAWIVPFVIFVIPQIVLSIRYNLYLLDEDTAKRHGLIYLQNGRLTTRSVSGAIVTAAMIGGFVWFVFTTVT